jgi:hypothetical protein
MMELSVLVVTALRFALGIADADRIGASVKVQAASPINRSRFMKRLFLWLALPRGSCDRGAWQCAGSQIVPWAEHRSL